MNDNTQPHLDFRKYLISVLNISQPSNIPICDNKIHQNNLHKASN